MNNIVRIWIGDPFEGGRFNGTAFFIDAKRLLTAKHVVSDREGNIYENIFISNTPDGGTTPINRVELCERDIAILHLKKSFNISGITFASLLQEGKSVNIIGFFDKGSSQKSYQNRVSGYQSHEHSYELQNHLSSGLSGSPVLIEDKIVGITTAINSKKNITYIIPISETCMDLKALERKNSDTLLSKIKNLSLEQMGIIATIIATVIGIVALFLPNNTGGNQATINNSNHVEVTQNSGKVDKTSLCQKGESYYLDTLQDREEELKNAIKYKAPQADITQLKEKIKNEKNALNHYKEACN